MGVLANVQFSQFYSWETAGQAVHVMFVLLFILLVKILYWRRATEYRIFTPYYRSINYIMHSPTQFPVKSNQLAGAMK